MTRTILAVTLLLTACGSASTDPTTTSSQTATNAPDGAPEGTACPGIGEIWCNGHCSACGMNTPGAGAEFVCTPNGCVAVCSAGFERVSMSQPENFCCQDRPDGSPTVVDGVPSCDYVTR